MPSFNPFLLCYSLPPCNESLHSFLQSIPSFPVIPFLPSINPFHSCYFLHSFNQSLHSLLLHSSLQSIPSTRVISFIPSINTFIPSLNSFLPCFPFIPSINSFRAWYFLHSFHYSWPQCRGDHAAGRGGLGEETFIVFNWQSPQLNGWPQCACLSLFFLHIFHKLKGMCCGERERARERESE